MDDDTIDALNAERLALIDRKFAGGLDLAEDARLTELKWIVYRYMAARFPRDTARMDEQAERLKAIRERLEGERRGQCGPLEAL